MSGPSGSAASDDVRVVTDVDGCVTMWVDRDGWWVANHARGQEQVRAIGDRPPTGIAAGSVGGRYVTWRGTRAEVVDLDGDALRGETSRAVPHGLTTMAVLRAQDRAEGDVWCAVDRDADVHVLGWEGATPTSTRVRVPGARDVFVSRRLQRFIVLGETVTVITPDAAEPAPWVAGPVPEMERTSGVTFDEVLEVVWRAQDDVLVAEGLREGRLVETYRIPVAPGATRVTVNGSGEWLLLGRDHGDDSLVNVAAQRELALPTSMATATVRAFGYDGRLCALSGQGVSAVDLPARAELRDVSVGRSTAVWEGHMTKTSSVALRRDARPRSSSRSEEASHA